MAAIQCGTVRSELPSGQGYSVSFTNSHGVPSLLYLAKSNAARSHVIGDPVYFTFDADGVVIETGNYEYRSGGAGFILYQNGKAIWETVTESEMRKYCKSKGIPADFRRTEVVVIR